MSSMNPAKDVTEQIRCPKCGRQQPKRGGHEVIYWCEWCRFAFDDEPEEGEDYDDRDPSRRMEREEERGRK